MQVCAWVNSSVPNICMADEGTIYAEIFARRKFLPVSSMHANSEIFLHSENFDTLNFAHVIVSAHAYAHSTYQ